MIYTDRDAWGQAITAACAPGSWHTSSSGNGIVYAMSGSDCVGYWDNSKNLGFIDARPAKSGTPWTAADDRRLRAGHEAGQSFEQLGEILQRSAYAVQARLVCLEVIPERGTMFDSFKKGSKVSNHPNRSKANRSLGQTPTPAEVTKAREASGLTQSQAGELIYSTLRAWQNYEKATTEEGHRRMHPQLFEAFLLKTGQAPRSLYTAIERARTAK